MIVKQQRKHSLQANEGASRVSTLNWRWQVDSSGGATATAFLHFFQRTALAAAATFTFDSQKFLAQLLTRRTRADGFMLNFNHKFNKKKVKKATNFYIEKPKLSGKSHKSERKDP